MEIIDYGMNGEGIGRQNGKVCFVKNALVNEEVEVKILSENKNFCRGVAQKIVKKSPFRAEPQCPYFNTCGGCQLQHFNYAEGLNFKRNLVQNTLKKIAGISIDVLPVVKSPKDYRYRNKSVFVARSDASGTRFGMYKSSSHDFLEIKNCLIACDEINHILSLCAEFYKNRREDNLKNLVIRCCAGASLITLVAKGKLNNLDDFALFLQKNVKKIGIFLNFNPLDDEILSGEIQHVCGIDHIDLLEDEAPQKIYPGSFLQVNSDVKKSLYAKVVSMIDEGDGVVDAYCGSGYLSYLISKKAAKVIGIESYPAAIKSANELKASLGIGEGIEFVLGDVKTCLADALKKLKNPCVVLDPPRKGCDPSVLKTIAAAKVKKIIYVSCNPISLSKDLKLLSASGYALTFAQPFDMFPNTANVETIVECCLK